MVLFVIKPNNSLYVIIHFILYTLLRWLALSALRPMPLSSIFGNGVCYAAVATDLKPTVASSCYLQPRPRSTPPLRGLADFGRIATLGEVPAVVASDMCFHIDC
jgi:hypothetical protein